MEIYIDGACRGNNKKGRPRIAGIGVHIPEINFKFGNVTDATTNNEAEYDALILALKTAAKKGIKDVKIYSDSQLIVNQVNGRINTLDGRWKINKPELREKMRKVKKFAKGMKVELAHIPRKKNKIADELANIAMDDMAFVKKLR